MLIAPSVDYTILSSNIDVDTAIEFVPNTGYATGTIVKYSGYRYESLSNVAVESPLLAPIVWYPMGRVNQDRMFDAYTNTETVSSVDIVLEIKSSDVDAVGVFGLYASSVEIEVTNNYSAEVYYSHIEDLETMDINDWYEWTVDEREYKQDFFVQIPILFDVTIKLIIKMRDGVVRCSHLSLGKTKNLGCTQWGATVSRRSNIKKERSGDGHVYLAQGISWRRMSVPVHIDIDYVDIVGNRLAEIDGIPTLFVGDDRENNIKAMIVFGFFRDLDINISVARGKYNIEIEGVG
ncbi:MAG: hypothetical protein QM493_02515 [Sulfurovum sp.]